MEQSVEYEKSGSGRQEIISISEQILTDKLQGPFTYLGNFMVN